MLKFIWVFVLIFAVSCSKKIKKPQSQQPSPSSPVQKYFVLGDPMALVAGASLNKKSFLTTQNFQDFNDYERVQFVEFRNREEIEDELGEIEDGQEAEEVDRTLVTYRSYKFTKKNNLNYVYGNPKSIDLEFELDTKNSLNLKSFIVDDMSIPVKVLHYSLSTNQQAFSILFSVTEGESESIISMVFVKKPPRNQIVQIPNVDKGFKFLSGPGVIARFNKNSKPQLEVSVCGSGTDTYKTMIENAVISWQGSIETVENVLPEITVTQKLAFKPFSDLEENCVYTVKNLLMSQHPNAIVGAITLTTTDYFRRNILSSDIFVMLDEVSKYKNFDYSPQEILRISDMFILHEFGHFFGLDHKFDGTPSVMSYDNEESQLYPYDELAIQNLYRN